MRIACIYLPSFPLQAHVRQAPHLAGTSLVVADRAGASRGAKVVACSRAAWADGLRPGMAVATARSILPEVEVATGDRALYQRALDAIVEGLLQCSDVIDGRASDALASHRVIYVKVPPRVRAAGFGHKLLTQIAQQGFRGRVGIADDRFTAYVAAVRVEHRGQPVRLDEPDRQPPLFQQSCTVVPRGGSAGFLAPLPLSYLPIDGDIQHLLQTCGVKTLGDFATLPPPSVSRDWLDEDSDFQALARGRGPATVHGQARSDILARPVIERIDIPHEAGAMQPLLFALRMVCEHVSQRLHGRDRAARAIELRLVGPEGESSALTLELPRPTLSGAELMERLRAELAVDGIVHPVAAMVLEVTADTEPESEAQATAAVLELFADRVAQPVASTATSQATSQATSPIRPATGMATKQAEAFRRAEGKAQAAEHHWTSHRSRRPRQRRAPGVQQMLAFCE